MEYRLSLSWRNAAGFWLATWLLLALSAMHPPVAKAQWVNIEAQVSADFSNPIRSRRNPDTAQVRFTVTNDGGGILTGPVRLVLTELSPAGVQLDNASGQTEGGQPYLDLSSLVGDGLVPGASTEVSTLAFSGLGRSNFTFIPVFEQQQDDDQPPPPPPMPAVTISTPATLTTLGASPVEVRGTVSDPAAPLTVNGDPVANENGVFATRVPLEEGLNQIIVRAVDDTGQEGIATVSVSLDKTPPYVTIQSHEDGQVVYTDTISVTGLVNDIVRGTVTEEEAAVQVNGRAARVSNRSYLIEDLPLSEGPNTLAVTAADAVGNVGSKEITVVYEPQTARVIEPVSGQSQSGTILTTLDQPLQVRLTDNGIPVVSQPVVFRVIQGDGLLAPGSLDQGNGFVAWTDSQGIARVNFQLGSRAGAGMHRVRVTSVGFSGEVIFHASADYGQGSTLGVIAGNNQTGSVWQPLANPFVVAVTDVGANLIPGVQVEFRVVTGGGRFENGRRSIVATTDRDGRATARFTLGPEEGRDAQRVAATLVGTKTTAGFTASAFVPGDPGQTRVSGVVLDNQDEPVPGVTVRVEGTNRQGLADAQGQFTIEGVPVGPLHLIVDGGTAIVEGEWPTLSYNLVTVPGVDNPLPGPIYLVPLDLDNALYVGLEDQVFTLPEIPGFKLEVKAGSVTFPNGAKEGYLSVTPVNANKVPMPPPNGMQPQFIVTIQPAGAMFDPPARLTLPNVDSHRPGAEVEMYSYDHDLEEFVTIGLGTVSKDGSVIASNPGVGVIKAGWHCGSQPGGSGCCEGGGDCGYCEDPQGECPTDCVFVPDRIAQEQTPGNCQKELCGGSENDDTDTPPEECGTCENGSPVIDEDQPLAEERQEPDDCKELLCGGGFNPKDETAAVQAKPETVCKVCEEGSLANAPNGGMCGDGSDAQSCYTCKDGKCDNHCQADSATNTFEHTAPNFVTGALTDFEVLLNTSPIFNAQLAPAIETKLVTGERCCKDCATPGPQDYREFSGFAGLKGKVLVTIPGLGGVKRFPPKRIGGGFAVQALLFATLAGASITVDAGGNVSYLDVDCPGEDCGSFSIGATLTGKFGPQAEGNVSLVSCSDGPCEDNVTLTEIAFSANITLNVSGFFGGKYVSGAQCGANCLGGKIDPVKAEAAITASVEILFKKYQYSDKVDFTVYEGGIFGAGLNCG
ncbi:MAG: carboxypeptidase-like regulatory domain-containing protein [Candidatus Competibacteraceae bacterium]|nr:carboxypeptidase-like regulatory domain-containing protein [Candidatus Competibacteraceae bacterium]